jgi:hypothetical protein
MGATLPFVDIEVAVDVAAGPGTLRRSDGTSGLGDAMPRVRQKAHGAAGRLR